MSELKIFYYLFLLTLLDATSQIRPSLHGHNNGESFSLRFLSSLFSACLLLCRPCADPRLNNNNRPYGKRTRLKNFASAHYTLRWQRQKYRGNFMTLLRYIVMILPSTKVTPCIASFTREAPSHDSRPSEACRANALQYFRLDAIYSLFFVLFLENCNNDKCTYNLANHDCVYDVNYMCKIISECVKTILYNVIAIFFCFIIFNWKCKNFNQ